MVFEDSTRHGLKLRTRISFFVRIETFGIFTSGAVVTEGFVSLLVIKLPRTIPQVTIFFSSLFNSILKELEFNQIVFEPCIPNLGDRGVRLQRQNESERIRKRIRSKKESLLLWYHTHTLRKV